MNDYTKTERNTVNRVPKRGHYDKKTVFEILDAGIICHVGFVIDNQPFVIPMAFGRQGDNIYLHGATTSRLQTGLAKGIPVCITVTHLDGIVLARSAFHSSMNYRSAVIFGNAQLVNDNEKSDVLNVVTNHIWEGRAKEVRPNKENELKGTSVLKVSIDQASAKIRVGPPIDDDEDYALPIWAGVIPINTSFGTPVSDSKLKPEIDLPESITSRPEEFV